MRNVKAWGSLIVTGLVFIAFFWVLFYVLHDIDSVPTRDAKGTLVKDSFERAKDVLIFVGPFASAAVGYWFGSDGKHHAENEAERARQHAAAADLQKHALLDSAQPGLLLKAMTDFPAAFATNPDDRAAPSTQQPSIPQPTAAQPSTAG